MGGNNNRNWQPPQNRDGQQQDRNLQLPRRRWIPNRGQDRPVPDRNNNIGQNFRSRQSSMKQMQGQVSKFAQSSFSKMGTPWAFNWGDRRQTLHQT